MYESPITMYMSEMQEEIEKQETEQLLLTVNQTIGFDVDKEELIKALQYDREQYTKGYRDCKNDMLDKVKQAREEIDAQCGRKGLDDYDYCSGLIFARNVLDRLIAESEN